MIIIFNAWLAMLLLGAAHHDLDGRVPALGYWTCVVLGLALQFLLAGVTTTPNNGKATK